MKAEEETTKMRLPAQSTLPLLYEWATHDLNHTMRAKKAVMQPFIRGSVLVLGARISRITKYEVANTHLAATEDDR